MAPIETSPDKSQWPGFVRGMRLGLPVAPGIMAFGVVVGAAAARQGLTFVQSLAMNYLVCRRDMGRGSHSLCSRGRGHGAPFPDDCLHAPMARATARLAGLLGAVF